MKVKVTQSWPTLCDPYWKSPGQNTGVCSLSLFQGIFTTQWLNTGLPHCRWILCQLSQKGSPRILEWVTYPFSSRSSQPRNRKSVSCMSGGFFTNWAIREAPLFTKAFQNQFIIWFSSVQSFSHVWLFATPWTTAHQASLSITNAHHYSNSCPLSQWCHPTVLSFVVPFFSCLQSFPASGFFSNESALHMRWPKYSNFSFNISPSNEHPGLISFRMDWLDLPVAQGTLKSLLQYHNSKASVLQCSAFFI